VNSATYSALDQPENQSLGNGKTTTWTYTSPMARLNQITTSGVFQQSYTYDAVGNIASTTDQWMGTVSGQPGYNGGTQAQSFTYDARDRLITVDTTGNSLGDIDQTYTYNSIGNILSRATATYRYPAAGSARPHAPISMSGRAYTYDANGNMLTDGTRWYDWDAQNKPTAITTASGSTTWPASGLSHLIGRSDSGGWSANTSQDAAGYLSYGPYTTSFGAGSYQATWNLLIDNNSANDASVVVLDVHDSTSNTVLATRTVTRKEWEAANTFQSFTLAFTLSASQANHQLQFRVYWLDTASVRMQNVIVAGKAAGVAETYRYDGDGQRVSRTVGGSITTTYVFGVYEQEGVIARKYYRFNGKPVAMREGASTVSYLHSDHLGSASAATNSSGVLTSWQRFDPWGKIRASNGSMPTKQNFTGQYLDDTGLLYYNARYYDPTTARFISADSIVPSAGALTRAPHDPVATAAWGKAKEGGPANPQDLNRYTYVLNNPVRHTDPTGHLNKPEPQGGAPGGLGGGGGGGGGQVDDEDDRRRGGSQGDGTTAGGRTAPQRTNPSTIVAKTPSTGTPSSNTGPTPPSGLQENPNRPGSWGKYDDNGKFREYWRYDKGDPGKPGWRGKDHTHHYGDKKHLPPNAPFDPNAPHPKDAPLTGNNK
jgi:RHS repeat-associated protein